MNFDSLGIMAPEEGGFRRKALPASSVETLRLRWVDRRRSCLVAL